MDDSGLSVLQVIIAQLGIQIGKGECIRKENFRIRVDRKDVGLIKRVCEQVAVFYLIGGCLLYTSDAADDYFGV